MNVCPICKGHEIIGYLKLANSKFQMPITSYMLIIIAMFIEYF